MGKQLLASTWQTHAHFQTLRNMGNASQPHTLMQCCQERCAWVHQPRVEASWGAPHTPLRRGTVRGASTHILPTPSYMRVSSTSVMISVSVRCACFLVLLSCSIWMSASFTFCCVSITLACSSVKACMDRAAHRGAAAGPGTEERMGRGRAGPGWAGYRGAGGAGWSRAGPSQPRLRGEGEEGAGRGRRGERGPERPVRAECPLPSSAPSPGGPPSSSRSAPARWEGRAGRGGAGGGLQDGGSRPWPSLLLPLAETVLPAPSACLQERGRRWPLAALSGRDEIVRRTAMLCQYLEGVIAYVWTVSSQFSLLFCAPFRSHVVSCQASGDL